MARDLLAFGKPTLVLGDPGQLPPVKGEGAFDTDKPDVLLTEVHRQAGDSAIIRLATWAREGKPIPYGEHDDFVWKMRRSDVDASGLLRAGQVICGKNATRVQLNLAMKQAAGFAAPYPTGAGEKLICLRNRNDIGLVNGMFLALGEIEEDSDEIAFKATITTEDGRKVGGETNGKRERFRIYRGHFDDHLSPDPDRDRRDYHKKRTLIECVWGWAITCHKAQGSQLRERHRVRRRARTHAAGPRPLALHRHHPRRARPRAARLRRAMLDLNDAAPARPLRAL